MHITIALCPNYLVSLCDKNWNRLIIFIHSALSFHGVDKVKSPKNKSRSTYYMDYYINDKNLNKFNKDLKKNKFVNLKYTFHSTSFLPLIPLGLGSFEFKSFVVYGIGELSKKQIFI